MEVNSEYIYLWLERGLEKSRFHLLCSLYFIMPGKQFKTSTVEAVHKNCVGIVSLQYRHVGGSTEKKTEISFSFKNL